jgi:ABC-2 type transport system permease protein
MILTSMNLAIWKKAVADAWRQLVASAVLLVLFTWLFAWLMSRFHAGAFGAMLNLLPNFLQPMLGVPLQKLATPLGQLSIVFIHVVTLLVCVGWALGRGSDSISGEIGRGTIDLLLSLPVWRVTVMLVPAVVTAIGTVLLAAAVWGGVGLGLLCFRFEPPVSLGQFLPGVANLAAMIFCFTGITTLASSLNRDRWRTIAWAGGLFIVSLIVKMVARLWPEGWWLYDMSFLAAFEPQELILMPETAGRLALQYNATLVGLGLACYLVAGIVFTYRDIPGPR